MRGRGFQFVRFLALVVLACLAAQPLPAQRGAPPGKAKPGKGQIESNRSPAPQKSDSPTEAGSLPRRGFREGSAVPPRWMERLRHMAPEEQERFLNNNQRFRNLPPERQRQIRERLRQWNSLPSEQQRALRERERIWEQMAPEQRRRVREEILPKWRQLDPQRRQALVRRLRVLRDLSETERAARLSDESFLSDLAPDERQLLRELSNLRVGPPPEQAEPPLHNPLPH